MRKSKQNIWSPALRELIRWRQLAVSVAGGAILILLADAGRAQTSITVPDYSFENPVTSSYQDNTGLVAGAALPGTGNDWYYLGGFIQTGSPVGVQNASANGMNGAVDGSQSLYLNNGCWAASTNLIVIQPNKTYTVTLYECNRAGFSESAGFTFGFAYGAQPGVNLTNHLIVSKDISLATVNANANQGNWFAYTLSFTTGSNDSFLGQSLFVVMGSDSNSALYNQQVNVDDVQLTFAPAAAPVAGPLPPGWSDADIGSPALVGTASFTNGLWSVSGGGTSIGGASDQFHFASTGLSSDGMIMAQINSQTGSDPGAQAGVMIRNDESVGAAEASVLGTPGNGVVFNYRDTAGGATAQSIISGIAPPVWVRLSRSANTFTAAYSSDGITWAQIGSPQAVSMTNAALAGLAVCSQNLSQYNTVSFGNVLLVSGAQAGIQTDLVNPYIGGLDMAWQTTWPLPQLNVVGNCLTPAMGWNSWFVVGDTIGPSENLITNTATSLVEEGLAAAGYKTVTIDCTWIASGRGYRNANADLIVDTNRWPDGMEAVADYVHSQGLLMGGYSDIGSSGYGSPPQIGMYACYQHDADEFASWGWDFIKIDDHGPGDFYAAANAVVNNGSARPIVLSLSTPQVDRMRFANRIANSFRVNNDIAGLSGSVTSSSILLEFDTAQADWYAQSPGHFLDPDMLMVGFNGISDLEGRTQFNLWSILGAPLMIGTDVRPGGGALAPAITATTINTLTNTEVIAVDQDSLGAVGRPVGAGTAVYAKPLGSFTSGQYAVLLANLGGVSNSISVNWGDVGMPYGSFASVRDLWAHQNLGTFAAGYISPALPPHGSMMLLVTGSFDWNRPRTYEAESSYNSFSGTAYYVPENPNFSSGAYVTGIGLGATNALQFNQATAPSNGLYEVDIYYACALNRTALLSVNGGNPTNLAFAATGGDTNDVKSMAVYLQLDEGENTLTIGNLTNLAPNIDKIVVSLGSPTDLQAVGADSQVALSWDPPASGVVSFNVYRGTTSGSEAAVPIASGLTTTNFTDTAVTNRTAYFYTVTASNLVLGGESPPSAEASAEPRYATTSYAFAASVLSNKPVAYWRLNETNGSTTAVDSVGHYNATYGSAVITGVAGPQPPEFLGFETTNTAVQLSNGVANSWLTMPALFLHTNAVTFTAWIYPIGAQAAYTGIVFCRSGSTVAGMNYDSAGQSVGYTWNNDQNTWGWSSGVQPPANQWSFVAAVVQPAGTVVYLLDTNGEQSATNAYANPSQAFAGSGTIGTDTYASSARVFNGFLDEVAVFNHALTQEQIQQLYSNGYQLPQVLVGFQTLGAGLNVNWPQGTLLESTNLSGPWLVVTNAVSPFTMAPTNAAGYFRVLLR